MGARWRGCCIPSATMTSSLHHSLTRDHLVPGSDHFAQLRAGLSSLIWSDEAIAASLAETLARAPATAGAGDIWLFAYGSLIWNPLFPVAEERIARVHGLHRSFCIWTRVGRGTPERPGLVLGLDAGGACKGVALRLEAAIARAELDLVWRREMLTGAYRPVWVRARTSRGDIDAIAFVANRASASYAGRLPEAEVCATITGARGLIGTCGDYLRQTHEGLLSRGIRDRTLERLLLRTGEGACA